MRLSDFLEVNNKEIFNATNIPVSLDPGELNLLYLNRSHQRLISPFFEIKYLNMSAEEFTLKINDFLRPYLAKWERLVEVLNVSYNPIENYNRIENETIGDITNTTNDVTQNDTIENNTKNTNSNTTKVYGYNNNVAEPSETLEETGSGNNNTLSKRIINNTGNDTKNVTKHSEISGNIGVTTTQQMINQELELRKNMVIDYIFSDVDNIITLEIYDI